MTIIALEKASMNDLEAISALLYGVVEHLNQSGIPQWDEVYPNKANVEEDLQNGELYVARAGGKIAGIITLNRESDPAYQTGNWSYTGPDYRVVHRLCVAADMQGQGIGGQIMRLTEDMLVQSGVKSLRLDVFSQNPHSLRLYEKLGYHAVGEALWRKGLFYLMEKNIAPAKPCTE